MRMTILLKKDLGMFPSFRITYLAKYLKIPSGNTLVLGFFCRLGCDQIHRVDLQAASRN